MIKLVQRIQALAALSLVCLCTCQGSPSPGPSPAPSVTPIKPGSYVTIRAAILQQVTACQANLPPGEDDSKCYFTKLPNVQVNQVVQLLVTVTPQGGFATFGRQLYIRVSLPSAQPSPQSSLQPSESNYQIAAAITISSSTFDSFRPKPSPSPSCVKRSLQTPTGVALSCDQVTISVPQPVLFSYVPGSTKFGSKTSQELLQLSDDNNASLLLLKQGFSLYQTSALFEDSVFLLSVVPTLPPAATSP
jgi:hypothetical protein